MRRAKSNRVSGFALLAGSIAATGFSVQLPSALANNIYDTDNTYHWQQTNFYCGPSSMEMMLDCPQVRNNPVNPVPAQVTNLFNLVGDGAIQDSIYNNVHPLNYTPLFGPGTDPVGYSLGVNSYDGVGQNYNRGSGHNYAWYGFVPNYYGATLASKTIANAIADFNIPATASVNYGGHWIDVSGVDTTAAAGAGKRYNINGFFVKDPWTGYVRNQINLGNYTVNNKGQAIDNTTHKAVPWGLGEDTFLRYGYDKVSTGPRITLPNGQQQNVRLGGWFRYFTPGGYAPVPYGGQYIAVVDPLAPELPDDGSQGDALPDPPTELSSQLNALNAQADAIGDIAGDSALNGDFPIGGNNAFDSADAELLTFGDDTNGQGDWMIPYDDGPDAANNVRGFVLVDAYTGLIDQATFLDPSEPDMTLAEIQEQASDLENVDPQLVFDDVLPEPVSAELRWPGGTDGCRPSQKAVVVRACQKNLSKVRRR